MTVVTWNLAYNIGYNTNICIHALCCIFADVDKNFRWRWKCVDIVKFCVNLGYDLGTNDSFYILWYWVNICRKLRNICKNFLPRYHFVQRVFHLIHRHFLNTTNPQSLFFFRTYIVDWCVQNRLIFLFVLIFLCKVYAVAVIARKKMLERSSNVWCTLESVTSHRVWRFPSIFDKFIHNFLCIINFKK